jgi:putative glutamine amidotransferase
MGKPLIGITVDCHYDPEDLRTAGNLTLNWNYAEAVANAGGVPIVIPPTADMEAIAGLIDGWLIPGGDDMDASHFGQENHPAVSLQDPKRYEAEESLYEKVSPDLPILGICYGSQFLNVVRGGSLIQHLPDVPGSTTHTGGVLQEYHVAPGSKLAAIVAGAKTEGKSYHHQAVDEVGSALSVSARSEDGTIESIEALDRPWTLAVQWHPERTLSDKNSRALFTSFVEAAADYASKKMAASPTTGEGFELT